VTTFELITNVQLWHLYTFTKEIRHHFVSPKTLLCFKVKVRGNRFRSNAFSS